MRSATLVVILSALFPRGLGDSPRAASGSSDGLSAVRAHERRAKDSAWASRAGSPRPTRRSWTSRSRVTRIDGDKMAKGTAEAYAEFAAQEKATGIQEEAS